MTYFGITESINLPSWQEKSDLDISCLPHHKSWNNMFKTLFNDMRFKASEESIMTDVAKGEKIYPKPDLLFNAFNITSLKNTKVVIIGQDPYFDIENHKNHNIPQAMGLSFSVPVNMKIPSSLKNIYANLQKHNNITSLPTHGNLELWAERGCLLLNTSLTVIEGTKNKNCHQHVWSWFTDDIIKYISDKKDHVVFVLWGRHAINKLELIDTKKHKIIASSHPSGLSCNQGSCGYPSFTSVDHFGKINNQLAEWNIETIDWNP